MKKTIASLLTMLLLLPACAFNVNVAEKMEPSTVLVRLKIEMHTKKGKVKSGFGTCSGVYIKKNVILTAAHCVDFPEDEGLQLKQVWIKTINGSAQAFPVKVDPAADLALLYTAMPGQPIKFAKHVSRGQDCWVIGNPLGLRDIITKGIVSKIGFEEKGEKSSFLIVDAVALPGNSGGAIVDSDGRLIGILTRGTSLLGSLGASGLGIGVDLKSILRFIKQ